MSIKKFPLEAYGAVVSREELVQAALDEITKNYREASLSNVARSYGVSLATSASASGRRQAVLTRNCSRSTGWRLRPPAAPQRLEHPADHHLRRYENTSYFYRLFHERYGQSPREYRQSRAARTRTPA